VIAAIVAAGAAVLSWDALTWVAGELGVDARVRWIFGIVVDGTIAMCTVAVLVLRNSKEKRRRAYAWGLLAAAIATSVWGNGAHAPAGGAALLFGLTLHQLGSAIPAMALAASLHLLVIISRESGARPSARSNARPQPAPARGRTAARVRVLEDQGLDTAAIAKRVGRSPSQVRRVRSALRSELRSEVVAT
jgi:hypothetical protein